jgi:protein SCO1/2
MAASGVPPTDAGERGILDGPFRLVLVLVAVLLVVIAARWVAAMVGEPAARADLTGDVTSAAAAPIRYDPGVAAPPLALTAQDGSAFALTADRGVPVFVFFGYTHCADVCPATVGILGQVLASYGRDVRAVFVTVDPARDTVAWLHEYVAYLQTGFSALTGTSSEVRAAADAWGVRYARVDGDTPDEYSMAHTADVYLVDGAGMLRARFPFGSDASTMLGVLRAIAPGPAATEPAAVATPVSTAAATTAPDVAATDRPIDELEVTVVSTAVWAGQPSPLIVRLTDAAGQPVPDTTVVSVQPTTSARTPIGPPVPATAVHEEGVAATSWVANVDVPTPGWAGLAVSARWGDGTAAGMSSVSALDPGGTAALGAPAPRVRTPTIDDVGGRILAVTTDRLPDPRLSQVSTADALAAGEPFVLVVDSAAFKVTPVCGTAVALAKYLLDRWTTMTFIHLEPYAYDVITDTAVLRGSLGSPTIVPAADAWGVASQPWGAGSMPWVFVVDRHGITRAKYQGVVGSAEIDVMLSLLAAEG